MTQKLQVLFTRRVPLTLALIVCRTPTNSGLQSSCVASNPVWNMKETKCQNVRSECIRPRKFSVRAQAGVRVLESVELDFSRYGDTLFEVLFAGGRLAGGGNVVEEGRKLDTNVCPTTRLAAISFLKSVNTCAHGLRAVAS